MWTVGEVKPSLSDNCSVELMAVGHLVASQFASVAGRPRTGYTDCERKYSLPGRVQLVLTIEQRCTPTRPCLLDPATVGSSAQDHIIQPTGLPIGLEIQQEESDSSVNCCRL